jgi:hypothetical protein
MPVVQKKNNNAYMWMTAGNALQNAGGYFNKMAEKQDLEKQNAAINWALLGGDAPPEIAEAVGKDNKIPAVDISGTAPVSQATGNALAASGFDPMVQNQQQSGLADEQGSVMDVAPARNPLAETASSLRSETLWQLRCRTSTLPPQRRPLRPQRHLCLSRLLIE